MGILSFLFGCKLIKIKKEDLYGDWEAVRLDGETVKTHEITFIKMNITADSIYVTTKMKTFGDITTKGCIPYCRSGLKGCQP